MVRQWQELFHQEKYSFTDLSKRNPNFVKIGEAFGLKSFSASSPAEVDGILDEVFAINDGPVLVEFKVVKENMVFPIIPSGATINEMMTKRLDPRRWFRMKHTITVLVKNYFGAFKIGSYNV